MVKQKIKIETKEIIFTLIGMTGIILWFVFLKDLVAPFLSSLPTLVAYPIFYSFIFLFIFLLSSILIGTFTKVRFSLALFSLLISLQLLIPPYYVSGSGVLNKAIEYWFIETDIFISSFWGLFGISGNLLWIFTYPVTIFITMFLIPIILLSSKKIAKSILDGFAK